MARRAAAVPVVAVSLLIAACGSGAPPVGAPVDGPASPDPAASAPAADLALTSGVARTAPQPDAPVEDLTDGFADAGFDLLREQPPDVDAVLSPFSIGNALLMARGAADDETRAAIDATFGLPAGVSAHEAWNTLQQAVAADAEEVDELTVTSASSLWPDTSARPDQAWLDLLAAQHGTTVTPLPLQDDPDGSRQVINEWAADRTEGLIPEPLAPGFIHGDTVLVLMDAVYFKAPWAMPFGKEQPVAGTFTRADGSAVEVDLLHDSGVQGAHGQGDGFTGAEIPYEGGDFSMLVLVPDERRFEEVRDRLGPDLLAEVDGNLTAGSYELLLPPWEDHAKLDLGPWLRRNGIAPGAYPGIDPAAALDSGVHAADITVDEWGTVAAAVTSLSFGVSAPPEPEFTLRADRPFLYVIRHVPTGAVLFAGQVADPTG